MLGASHWQADVLAGRETSTRVEDGAGTTVSSTLTTYGVLPLADGYTYDPWDYLERPAFPAPGQQYVNFVYSLQTVTTLADLSQTYTQNIYDVNDPAVSNPTGNLERVNNFTGTAPVSPTTASPCTAADGCQLSTFTPYVYDTADWIFVPKFEAQFDPQNSNKLVSCTRMYYDGSPSAGTLPASGARGLLTAKSTATSTSTAACDATTAFPANGSSNSYTAYDQYGNAVTTSVATTVAPETYAPPASLPGLPPNVPDAAHGWIPTGVPYATTAYDSTYHIFPVTQTSASDSHAAAETTTTTYNYVFGKPATATAPNGDVTTYQYDTFGRLTDVYDSLDSADYPTQHFIYNWGSTGPNQTVTLQRAVSSTGDATITISCADGLGREVEHEASYASSSGPMLNDVRTDYDARGMKAVVTNASDSGTIADPSNVPACPASPAAVTGRDRTDYAYDALGNVATTTFYGHDDTTHGTNCTAPLGPVPCTETIANGLSVTQLDELGHKTVKVSNPGARTLTVNEYTGDGSAAHPYSVSPYATTTSKYDALGELIQVTDAQNNNTVLFYDLAGRKTSMGDPDMHTWSYSYDAAGNLVSQTDSRHVTTTLHYDALNRLYEKEYSNGDPTLQFVYDHYTVGTCLGLPAAHAMGHATAEFVTGGAASVQCYDVRGETTRTSTYVGGVEYDVGRTFNDAGAVISMTYPDGEVVQYPTDAAGETTGLTAGDTGVVSNATFEPWGAAATMPLGATGPFGSAETTTYGYDSRGRVTTIQTGELGHAGESQSLTIVYDQASNVSAVNDGLVNEQAGFVYDDLNRLKSMSLVDNGTAQTGAAYTYDTIGNLITKQEGVGLTYTLFYKYGCCNVYGAHTAYMALGSDGSVRAALNYDANGNLCNTGVVWGACTTLSQPHTGESLYTYDAENRLVSMPDGTAGTDTFDTFTYDASGTEVKRTLADGTYTLYIGGIYEEQHAASGTLTGVTKYYEFGGRAVAMRDPAGTVHYLLADHLGSTSEVLAVDGTIESLQKYWPYGASRPVPDYGPVTQTDRDFTGQRKEVNDPASIGLYNYEARFYSTLLGRFVSADTVADGLNRYEYVRDNPLRYVDPNGRCFTLPDGTKLSSCSEGDALRWLNCAFGDGCSGDVQKLARGGIGESGYWEHILKFSIGSDFMDTVLLAVAKHGVTVANLNIVPSVGWNAMGVYYRVSGAFMEASFYDVANGTATIDALGSGDLIGAHPWWIDSLEDGSIGHRAFDLLSNMIPRWSDNAFSELGQLDELTVLNALEALNPLDISASNQLPWSPYQRQLLFELHIPGIALDGVDLRGLLWDKWSDCVLDVACGLPLDLEGGIIPS